MNSNRQRQPALRVLAATMAIGLVGLLAAIVHRSLSFVGLFFVGVMVLGYAYQKVEFAERDLDE